MDNKLISNADKSGWTLHDWVMAETGDGQSRAEYIKHMMDAEARENQSRAVFTNEESEILYGLQFDQERIKTLAVGSKDQLVLNAIVEEMANTLKTNIFVTARARQQKQQESP